MSGIASKLSRHVLGMKFMRKTKDNAEKVKVEKAHREHFAADTVPRSESTKKLKNEPSVSVSTDTPSSSLVVEELWSYNQCEHYIFGRQSYGGFNPAVENNVKKGIWRPFYLEDAPIIEDSDEDVRKAQSDVDVSDEEMAKTYGSLIGTLAKRFRKRNKKEALENKSEDGDTDAQSSQNGNKNKNQGRQKQGRWNNRRNKNEDGEQEYQGNQKGNWKKKKWNKNKNSLKHEESSGYDRSHPQKPSKRHHDYSADGDQGKAPPQKKRKFLKPSDD